LKSYKNKNISPKTRITEAVGILGQGGVISFPTETYYGLGVDPFKEVALEKLFRVKKRLRDKPILVLVDSIDMLSDLVTHIPDVYWPILKKYWPGPLTCIFPAAENINPLLTGGTQTIGIRISSHPVVDELLRVWQKPVTATSANISGKEPACDAFGVSLFFGEQVDCVIDGGETSAGACSTIVSCKNERLRCLRRGKIPFTELVALTQ